MGEFQKLISSVAQVSDGRKGRYSLFLFLFTACLRLNSETKTNRDGKSYFLDRLDSLHRVPFGEIRCFSIFFCKSTVFSNR